MNTLVLIGIGGGIGSICRYSLANFVYWLLGRDFPIGTLIVNVSGCFLMGLLFVLFLERWMQFADQGRALLLVGFLGGFTTFSSFSIETLNLIEYGKLGAALVNILLSMVCCLLATWIGIWLGRQ